MTYHHAWYLKFESSKRNKRASYLACSFDAFKQINHLYKNYQAAYNNELEQEKDAFINIINLKNARTLVDYISLNKIHTHLFDDYTLDTCSFHLK